MIVHGLQFTLLHAAALLWVIVAVSSFGLWLCRRRIAVYLKRKLRFPAVSDSGTVLALLPWSGTLRALLPWSGTLLALLPWSGTVLALLPWSGTVLALLPWSGTLLALCSPLHYALPQPAQYERLPNDSSAVYCCSGCRHWLCPGSRCLALYSCSAWLCSCCVAYYLGYTSHQ